MLLFTHLQINETVNVIFRESHFLNIRSGFMECLILFSRQACLNIVQRVRFVCIIIFHSRDHFISLGLKERRGGGCTVEREGLRTIPTYLKD